MFSHHKPKIGYVYLVQRQSGEVKIGSTESDIRTRLTLLASKLKCQMTFLRAIPSECPKLLERRLQDRFKNNHIGNEWFALAEQDYEWLLNLCPLVARQYVPEANSWYSHQEAEGVYDGLVAKFARTMKPSGKPGRFSDMMIVYWTDAFRSE